MSAPVRCRRYDEDVTAVDYDLRFDAKRRVLLITMGSVATKASVLAAYNAVQRFIISEGACSVIADLSAVERETVPGYFVQSLASMPSMISPENWLILVAPQAVVYGLSRMFHSWRDEKPNCKIVRTLEEAYTLLGLGAPDFEAIQGSVANRGVPLG
jgi:hypothetical protein